MKPAHSFWFALILMAAGCVSNPAVGRRDTGPWDMAALKRVPSVTWGERHGAIQELYYQGEPLSGKPTRIFAYLGRPKGAGPFPAMVLVHGGGGRAFKDWAAHWAGRGYVALAMDTAGQGPDGKPLPDGGPDQSDATKFRHFTAGESKEVWTYHAVAAVIRGHSLLASLPEVDASRIGITGISWGGYLTCIVAGLDDRLKVAVPVYGCGFLGDNSYWKDKSLAALTPDERERWLANFDPSRYLGQVRCPILFLNGSNDFAYPMDSYRKSYQLVPELFRAVSVIPRLPHGHIWTFEEVDSFVAAELSGKPRLPQLGAIKFDSTKATVKFTNPIPLAKAELNYTTSDGVWQQRLWQSTPARIEGDSVLATLPSARPLTFFISVTDERGLRVSTGHAELGMEK